MKTIPSASLHGCHVGPIRRSDGRCGRCCCGAVREGRCSRAPTCHPGATASALVLAQVLLEHGAAQDALEIAEHGLSLAGELWTLATWLRDEAATAGDADR